MSTHIPTTSTRTAARKSTAAAGLGSLPGVVPLALTITLSWALLALAVPSPALAGGCANEALRVGPSAYLPDCRAYEQVTPVAKDGGLLVPGALGVGAEGTPTVLVDTFAALAGIEDLPGIPGGFYSIRRTPSGWVTSPMALPASAYETKFADEANSLEGGATLMLAKPKSPAGGPVNFITRAANGAIAAIGPATPPGIPPEEAESNFFAGLETGEFVRVRGVADDLSHVLFTIDPDVLDGFHYWPFDETILNPHSNYSEPDNSLYEYVGTGNSKPLLVGVNEEGRLISKCQTLLGNAESQGGEHNAVSADGETVFFTAYACGSTPSVNELFARVGNGRPGAHTVAISEPPQVDCGQCDTGTITLANALFQGASEDGSKVFFTTTQPLLGGDATRNLYEYDFTPPAGQPKVVRVSGGDSTVSNPAAEVQSVMLTSEDGSHVYFVARGVLTKTANSQGQVAREGADNLYVFERDEQYPAGRTAFIGSLEGTSVQEANATPEGRFLVFLTGAHLTADDTSPDAQVFEYDAQTGSLVRVSIGEKGYNQNGNAETDSISIPHPEYFSSMPLDYWGHMAVSSDGAYVFFSSAGALTPRALNNVHVIDEYDDAHEETVLTNVYEYHEGHVYLISDGHDMGIGDGLVGTDMSGADVFFTSVDQLALQDTDTDSDVYDARIGGGFPAAAVPVECSGDGCQGALSGAPVLLSPGSEFQAGGNPSVQAPAASAKKAKAKRAKQKPKKHKSKTRRRKTRRRVVKNASGRGLTSGKAGRS